MNQDTSVDKLDSMVDERGITFRYHEIITFCKPGVCVCVCVYVFVCVPVCVVCVCVCVFGGLCVYAVCVCVCVCVCMWCVYMCVCLCVCVCVSVCTDTGNQKTEERVYFSSLTPILLTWRIWRVPNNASKWQRGFNPALKVIIHEWIRIC